MSKETRKEHWEKRAKARRANEANHLEGIQLGVQVAIGEHQTRSGAACSSLAGRVMRINMQEQSFVARCNAQGCGYTEVVHPSEQHAQNS